MLAIFIHFNRRLIQIRIKYILTQKISAFRMTSRISSYFTSTTQTSKYKLRFLHRFIRADLFEMRSRCSRIVANETR